MACWEGLGAGNKGCAVLGGSKVIFAIIFKSVLAPVGFKSVLVPGIAFVGVETGVGAASMNFYFGSSVLSLDLGLGFAVSSGGVLKFTFIIPTGPPDEPWVAKWLIFGISIPSK